MKHSIIIAVALLAAATVQAAEPEGTLDKVKRSGTLVMGIRESSYPLSYLDGSGKAVGYHVDVCGRVADELKARLALPGLKVVQQPVTSQNRIAKMVQGEIDLECGSTTNNASRQRDVAFAPTTFVATVRVAVRKDSGLATLAQLNGKPVATTAGSTSVQLLQARQQGRDFKIVEMQGADHAQSFAMLEDGRAAAFVMDDNLLAGLIAASKNPGDYALLPDILSVEPIAVMLRKGDPAFKAVVDDTVKGLMKRGELDRLYAIWFQSPIPPRQANLNFAMSDVLRNLIRYPSDEPVEAFRSPE